MPARSVAFGAWRKLRSARGARCHPFASIYEGSGFGTCVVPKLEPERRPLPVRAVEPERAAVGVHDLAAERKPEADALDPAARRVCAEELREDAVLLIRRDPDPVVAYRDADDS